MEIVGINYNPFKHGEIVHVTRTTAQQKEIWLASQFSREASLAYIQALIFEFEGQFEDSSFKQALTTFCEKHPLTRATFSPDGEYLCVNKNVDIQLAVDDQTQTSDSEFQEFFVNLKQQETATPFDLTSGPLFRASLVKRSPEKFYLLVSSHHIVCDGGSLEIITSELPHILNDILSGNFKDQGPYKGNAKITQNHSKPSEIQKSSEYWSKEFGNIPSSTELPSPPGFSRPANRTFNSKRYWYELSAESIIALEKTKTHLACTFPVIAYGIFVALIHRLSNQQELVIGLPSSSRIPSKQRAQFGHFASILPIKHEILENTGFDSFIKSVIEKVYASASYSATTFSEIVNRINFPIDKSRVPLAPITFNTNEENNVIGTERVNGSFEYLDRMFETFELTVNLLKRPDKSLLCIDYNSDIFSEDTAKTIAECYQKFSCLIAENPSLNISNYIIVPNEQLELMDSWNQKQTNESGKENSSSKKNTLHSLFEHQVEASPNSIAVVFENTELSYEKLNNLANRIANFLTTKHNVSGHLVGLCVERSENMLAVLLGISKAGASYLPLDPEYPKDRIAYILEDAGVNLLITESGIHSVENFREESINIDEIWNQLDEEGSANLDLEVEDNSPCYVIYTSGSTGKPKGVQVAHNNVFNFLKSMAVEPGLDKHDNLLAVTTLSFDIAVLELYLPITVGATTHIASRNTSMDGEELIEYVEKHSITALQATPATWRMMLQSGWNGSKNLKGLIGGEALPKELLPELLPRIKELWNMYGPTETTVWSTCQQIVDPEGPVYIGHPIKNTQIYVLDHKQSLLPLEIPGELCIGGDGVTLGYLGRPELTSERFINIKTAGSTKRVYRTGDLVRLHKTGVLEYLNRLDNQVKIRGFRIELGEIEASLSKIEGIDQCVVIAHQFGPSDQRLVAYVKMELGANLTSTEMRKELKHELPDYMLPQFFVDVENIPLSPSGKVDRKALPDPAPGLSGPQESNPPTSKVEIALAEIWQNVLKIEQIDLSDFFFDIGGHSLLAVETQRKIQKKFNVKIAFADLLMNSFGQISTKIETETESAPKTPDEKIESPNHKAEKKSFLRKLLGS